MQNMIHFDDTRMKRMGFGEAVMAQGKTLEDIVAIVHEVGQTAPLLVTRLSSDMYAQCLKHIPHLAQDYEYNAIARVLRSQKCVKLPDDGFNVAVLTAGTSDRSVAEEVIETLKHYSIPHRVFGDIGVAGIHRLLNAKHEIDACSCIVCVAGMDGALASVVAGIFAAPVIGVPTSVGYGSAQHGRSALLSMLNSCAQGLCVMNIDNGFGAAMAAIRIKNKGVRS